jgi:2-polyprenyl-3-methyl-5-hydroxy-6-metoxy-1,4-benzoquinol methylase
MKESDIRDPSVHQTYLEMVRQDALHYFDSTERCETVVCPACESEKSHSEFKKFGFQYVSCDECKTLYVNPRPKLRYLEEFYVNSPSSHFWVEKFFKPVIEARRKKIFKPRAEHVVEYLNGIESTVFGDIGAGFGLFLEELRRLRPDVRSVAIEPSPEMAKLCRELGLEVEESMIENLKGFKAEFDFLTTFELFEHIHDPRAFIKTTYQLLKAGGRLLITTLNGQGFDIQLLWNASRAVFPPHHLNFFNPESLCRLLRDVGFEIDLIETPGALDWDIVEGAMQRGEADIGRFWKLVKSKGSSDCKKELQEWLVRHQMSSHMRVIARKI